MRLHKLFEGYSVLPAIDREKYGERNGLEGPYRLRDGSIVYYDAKEGKYIHADQDIYLDYDEYAERDRDPNVKYSMGEAEELEEAKPKDIGKFLYGEDSFMSKVKRFFTLNWIEPMNGNKEHGIRALRKAGFDNSEIKEIRDAVYIAVGEAIDKFGDPEAGRPDDSNFTGWMIDMSSPASGGVFADEKVKQYVKKRVGQILQQDSVTEDVDGAAEPAYEDDESRFIVVQDGDGSYFSIGLNQYSDIVPLMSNGYKDIDSAISDAEDAIEAAGIGESTLEERVSVDKKTYSWGVMTTIRDSRGMTFPIHPNILEKLKTMTDGKSGRYKDETGKSIKVTREGDNLIFTPPSIDSVEPTVVSFTEVVGELEENWATKSMMGKSPLKKKYQAPKDDEEDREKRMKKKMYGNMMGGLKKGYGESVNEEGESFVDVPGFHEELAGALTRATGYEFEATDSEESSNEASFVCFHPESEVTVYVTVGSEYGSERKPMWQIDMEDSEGNHERLATYRVELPRVRMNYLNEIIAGLFDGEVSYAIASAIEDATDMDESVAEVNPEVARLRQLAGIQEEKLPRDEYIAKKEELSSRIRELVTGDSSREYYWNEWQEAIKDPAKAEELNALQKQIQSLEVIREPRAMPKDKFALDAPTLPGGRSPSH